MVMKSEIENNKVYMTLLENEMMVLQYIKHPRIVKVLAIMEDNYYYSIVTEILNGGNMQEYLKKNGAIPEPTTRCIVFQLVEAIVSQVSLATIAAIGRSLSH